MKASWVNNCIGIWHYWTKTGFQDLLLTSAKLLYYPPGKHDLQCVSVCVCIIFFCIIIIPNDITSYFIVWFVWLKNRRLYSRAVALTRCLLSRLLHDHFTVLCISFHNSRKLVYGSLLIWKKLLAGCGLINSFGQFII